MTFLSNGLGKIDLHQEPRTCEIDLSLSREDTKLTDVSQFLADTDTYNQNLLKLVKYCHVSQVAHKLQGFVEKYKDSAGEPDKPRKGVGAFLETIQKKETSKSDTKTRDENRKPGAENLKPGENTRKPGSSPLLGVVEFLSTLATNFGDSRIVVKFSNKLAGNNRGVKGWTEVGKFTELELQNK